MILIVCNMSFIYLWQIQFMFCSVSLDISLIPVKFLILIRI